MSLGPSKRQGRSSVEEGPTIYKCDQLRQMLESALQDRAKRHANIDPVKLLGGYLPVRTEANGKVRPKGDEEDNPSSARFHSFCKQLAVALGVSKEFILERLSRFPCSYHVSDYAPTLGVESRRVWFAGRASLECTSNGSFDNLSCRTRTDASRTCDCCPTS